VPYLGKAGSITIHHVRAVHGCRGLQPEVLADLAGLPAFALVRFAQVPQICILLDIRGE
jgi:hypothetical protein